MGKWNKENCQIEALKYETRTEFQKKSGSAYRKAYNKKWLDDVCSHMISKRKPNGYWTKEKCQEEALKYSKKSLFSKKSYGSYNNALKNGWLGEICSHMIEYQKPDGYWTKEKCQEEALKYNSRSEIRNKPFYKYSIINGWLGEITTHLSESKKPKNHWTIQKCREEALKYKTKKDFRMGNVCYSTALKNGWVDEICSHMVKSNNDSKRCIYAYEFKDNHVYVGLTNNLYTRNNRHMKDIHSQVYKHEHKSKLKPILKKLTGYIDVKNAQKKEGFYVKTYKLLGWNILNIAKTGGLGSPILIWTKEKCQEEALQYKHRYLFCKQSSGAYTKAQKNKWLDEICSHMIYINKPSGYWTKEQCHKESLNYYTRNKFKINSISAYSTAQKNKWLDEICSHMN